MPCSPVVRFGSRNSSEILHPKQPFSDSAGADSTFFTDPEGATPDRGIRLLFVTGLRRGEAFELFLCLGPGYEWTFQGLGSGEPRVATLEEREKKKQPP